MRVLVVDDDAVFRDELSDLLREEDHEVQTAPNVAKAIEWLEHEEADVVLTDLKMPRQSGLVLLREVRARWPRTCVVMITGYATIDTALEAMKAGAFDYLRKPFRIEELRSSMQLAAQQRAFEAPAEASREPAAEARELARSGSVEVLFIGQAAPRASAHLHFEPLDPTAPSALVDHVRRFVEEHPKPAVVIGGVESLLARHRLEDVLGVLDQLRALLRERGPLRVGFDPSRLSAGVATAVGDAVADEENQGMWEALANPIRRKALQRSANGSASFGELMAAAGLDDSPKMSFHLRRLLDAGLLRHEGESYRLTSRGSAVLDLLTDATLLPPRGGGANRAFPQGSPPSGRHAGRA
jgi:DNA-binding response OmpR family regulator